MLRPPPRTDRSRYAAFISYSHELDTDIAPRVQQALERVARPLLKRRALSIFRDSTGLASGGLWDNVVRAMDRSKWLVLLCSVRAATLSPDKPDWVGREIRRWLATKGADRIILVLTDGPARSVSPVQPSATRRGGLMWDESRGDFDPARSPSLHPALFGVFDEQPLWADLSDARDDPQMSHDNPRFLEMLAPVFGKLHGRDPNEVFGEDVRIHRRNRRLVAGAITSLSALLVAAIAAGLVAVANEREANRQRATATSRALAAQSLVWNGPRAMLLAAEAHDADPTAEAVSALLAAIDTPATSPRSDNMSLFASFTHQGAARATATSVDGTVLVTLDDDDWLHIWHARPRAPRTAVPTIGDLVAMAGTSRVAVAIGQTITWVDTESGATLGQVDVGDQITGLASASDGVLVGTGSGGVALVMPDSQDVRLHAGEHVARITALRETSGGVVTADAAGRVVTRDAVTLDAHTTVAAEIGGRVVDISADGAAVLALDGAALESGGTLLASVFSAESGQLSGSLAAAELVTPIDAVFTGVADEVAVLAGNVWAADTSGAMIFRGEPGDEALAIHEADSGWSVADGRIAFPENPSGFLHGGTAGTVGVTGQDATVLSDIGVVREDEIELEWLAGRSVPLSVSPATGMMLAHGTSGLALADLNQAGDAPPPLTDLGIVAETGWLAPDGQQVLVKLMADGALTHAAPGAQGWLVPAPALQVVPSASLDGSLIAFAGQDLIGEPSEIYVVDRDSGEIVAQVTPSDPLCRNLSCVSWRGSHLALSPDGDFLALRTAEVEAANPVAPDREMVTPQVVLYDLRSGEMAPTTWAPDDGMGLDWERQGFVPAPNQGPVRMGIEVARYSAAATSVPVFGSDGVLRFHDGRASVLAVDPGQPGQAGVTANQASGAWVLDEHGVPVVAAGCTVVVLGADAQPVNADSRPGDGCLSREVAWISDSRTLVLDGTQLLPLGDDDLRQMACVLAGRNLTEVEWRQFFGDAAYRRTCSQHPVPERRADLEALPSPTATPPPEPQPVDRIIVQPGLPDPPHHVSTMDQFPGREELLGFLRDYFGDDLGVERAEAQACFMPPVPPPTPTPLPPPPPPPGVTPAPEPELPPSDPDEEPWERAACVGLIRVEAEEIVAADFVGDVVRDWLLLEPADDSWELSAVFREGDSPVPPKWVADSLR